MSHVIEDRVCDGRIVDGHGDLRPDHIYLTPTPVIIDCIEFNAEFRRNDIVDELSFLAMECERIGNKEVGQRVLQRYSELSGDLPPPQLIAFYKCYRACVRAKVAALRAAQVYEKENRSHHQRETQSYLQLASRFAKQVTPPLIISVGGLMGTGKSTLADQLADELFTPLQRTDDLRRELFHTSGETLAFGKAKYTRANRLSVYERMLGETPLRLESNAMAIVDGTFSMRAMRALCHETAQRNGCRWLHVECVCPRETSLARIAERQAKPGGSTSEARPQLYDSQLMEYETPMTSANSIQVDTTEPLSEQIDSVTAAIRNICA